MSAARMHREDLEELARLIAKELRGVPAASPAPAPARVPVTDRHRKMAADYLSRPKKIRHTR